MRVSDFLTVLAREGEALIGAASRAGADAPVPSCPGWRARDLVLHQGHVHRWATGFVAGGLTRFVPLGSGRVPDGELAGWFREGHRALLAALQAAPEDLVCWTFLAGSPSPRHFWARRQTHETTVHRIDAELAVGGVPGPVAAEVAVDGIDELLTGFHRRERSRVRSERPRTLGVRVTDGAGAFWRVLISEGPPRAERVDGVTGAAGRLPVECEISGRAGEVYQALWNRRPVGAGVAVAGDAAVAELWRATSGI